MQIALLCFVLSLFLTLVDRIELTMLELRKTTWDSLIGCPSRPVISGKLDRSWQTDAELVLARMIAATAASPGIRDWRLCRIRLFRSSANAFVLRMGRLSCSGQMEASPSYIS